MLFKRFESSVYAFRQSLKRLEKTHELFLKAMGEGFVPAGEDAQALLYASDRYEESDLLDTLKQISKQYELGDFDEDRLCGHLKADLELIRGMIGLVYPITPEMDDKLQMLIGKLHTEIPKKTGKVLIFTQYADTARYLFENLNPEAKHSDIESIYGTDKSKGLMAARFAPKANPHTRVRSASEVRILVATDVMSEGLNLQDCDVVVNYDLHWNPVRLIQRFGRIDRIGSKNDVIWGHNFLPEKNLEKNLGLTEVLLRRIAEIMETIGEDSAILDKNDQVNEVSMYAIYGQKTAQLNFFEDEEGELIDLNEAKELFRSLRKEDPEEFERIVNLRDGIRSAKATFRERGRYLFCQAGRFQQLMFLDEDDNVVSQDIVTVAGKIKCSSNEPTAVLPADHNTKVMKAPQIFSIEVRHRIAQQKHSLSLTVGQTCVLRELRIFYSRIEDEDADLKAQISLLEEAFRRPVTKTDGRRFTS